MVVRAIQNAQVGVGRKSSNKRAQNAFFSMPFVHDEFREGKRIGRHEPTKRGTDNRLVFQPHRIIAITKKALQCRVARHGFEQSHSRVNILPYIRVR